MVRVLSHIPRNFGTVGAGGPWELHPAEDQQPVDLATAQRVIEALATELAAHREPPGRLILPRDTSWRLRFARYGNAKQRARLSAQAPRARHQRKRQHRQ